jgi:tetratricopeptide (TPR) repeat protein
LLGAHLTDAGLAKEAVARLEPYTGVAAGLDVLIAYGVALASTGRGAEALAAFERARALDRMSGLPLTNIGMRDLMAGAGDKAAAAFNEALTIDATLARRTTACGVVAAQRGALEEAAHHWKQAVVLDQARAPALVGGGDVLIRLGRPGEARTYWASYLREVPPASDAKDRTRVRNWLTR